MCLIVDANAAGQFLAKPGAVRDWLLGDKGQPRLAAAGALRRELAKVEDVRRLIVQLERAGRLRTADQVALDEAALHLRVDSRCRSNDHHVLAVAVVTGARTLATFDKALAADFKDGALISRPRGSIYQNPEAHAHLLRHTPADLPSAAGRHFPCKPLAEHRLPSRGGNWVLSTLYFFGKATPSA